MVGTRLRFVEKDPCIPYICTQSVRKSWNLRQICLSNDRWQKIIILHTSPLFFTHKFLSCTVPPHDFLFQTRIVGANGICYHLSVVRRNWRSCQRLQPPVRAKRGKYESLVLPWEESKRHGGSNVSGIHCEISSR